MLRSLAFLCVAMLCVSAMASPLMEPADAAALRRIAGDVLAGSRVAPEGEIPGVGRNKTGVALRLPGATQTYYPAFWVRDAAMMLGADFVPREEVEGWIRLIASVQPGPAGLRFAHGLRIPPYSVPDHITLKGEACWFPGAYAEQGTGQFGLLPPADDAFYFVGMVREQVRLARNRRFLAQAVPTLWGRPSVLEVAERAFGSVAVDEKTQLVVVDPKEPRVDWGFCDTIRKSGKVLMPSLLRWRAARQLAELHCDDAMAAHRYRELARRIGRSVREELLERRSDGDTILLSATGTGRQGDIWASAFALWLGVLPKREADAVSATLVRWYRAGRITQLGQVRHLVAGEHWQSAISAPETYQNGGYWGTATGWLAVAMARTDPAAGRQLVREYVTHLRAEESRGAPFEWIHPATDKWVNPCYASSAGLVWVALTTRS